MTNVHASRTYFTDHASSPWPPLPPHFSLTIKKQEKQVTKKCSGQKQAHVRDETLKMQPN